jgi:hypothetical protein
MSSTASVSDRSFVADKAPAAGAASGTVSFVVVIDALVFAFIVCAGGVEHFQPAGGVAKVASARSWIAVIAAPRLD